jgi:nucleoside 2-deoxyribosyltransferase
MMYDVYIAGELTRSDNPERMKQFYERISAVCKEAGLNPYLPHQHTDPREHPEHTPQYVYQRNRDIISNAKLIIAYVGKPSLGTGCELEIANSSKVKALLHHFNGEKVSRMARGSPSVVKVISYDTEEDALRLISEFLESL